MFGGKRQHKQAVVADLTTQLERSKALVERRAEGEAIPGLTALSAWQVQRLRNTYRDFLADPRHRPVLEFFQTDLYGARDFSQRDLDLLKIAPIMSRVMPAEILQVAARAIELNVVSQELDEHLARELFQTMGVDTVTPENYAEGYRRADERDKREHQIHLVVGVCEDLGRYCEQRWLRTAMHLAHRPAEMVGLSALHHFLERGIDAFAAMGDPRDFLQALEGRETALMERIFANDPEPFRDIAGDA